MYNVIVLALTFNVSESVHETWDLASAFLFD